MVSSRPMVRATLTRNETSDHGTFGQLQIGSFHCFTGELPDRSNQPNISCIPSGLYICQFTWSNRFKKKMYEVLKVPNRAGIRIHSANLMGDKSKGLKCQLNGCISLGFQLGRIEGQRSLLLSKPAIRQFETLLNGNNFILEIK